MRELIQQCQAFYDAHRSQSALDQLAKVSWSPDAGVPSANDVDALLLKIRCLIRLERFRDAFRLVDMLTTPDPPEHRCGEMLRLKGILWRLAQHRVDPSILVLERAVQVSEPGAERAKAMAELAYSWAIKGCYTSANEAIEQAREESKHELVVGYRHGQLLLLARDLYRSRACFTDLRQLEGGDRLARDGLAFIELALGDLPTASAHLDALGPALPDELWLRRRRLDLLSVIDPEAELSLLEEIRQTSPDSDHAQLDELRIAELCYLAGDHPLAQKRLTVLQQGSNGAIAASASRLAAAVARLPHGALPDIVQLNNVPFLARARHPGTAALELMLTMLGRKVEPEWLPEVETLGWAAEFFQLAGIATARFTGDIDDILRALAVGAPVLVGEARDRLRLVVGVDRTRNAVLLRDPSDIGVHACDLVDFRPLLEAGALAALPAHLDESPVISHPGLTALDGAQRLFEHGRDDAAVAQLIRLTETLPAARLSWNLLLEYDLDRLEWDAQHGLDDICERIEQRIAAAAIACGDGVWLDIHRGRLLELQGELERAAAAYDHALEHDDDLDLLIRAGETHRQLNHQEVAERLFWSGLERAPAHSGLNMSIAGLYCDEEDTRMARHFVRVALELAPQDAYNLLNLGRLREMEGAYEAAAEAYAQSLLQRRGDPFVLERLGVALSFQGRSEEGAKRLQEAIDLKEGDGATTNIPARLSLADLYLRAGEPQQALDVCKALLGLDPENPMAQAIGGVALIALDQVELGIALLRSALERDPDYHWARQHMAAALQQSGRIGEARELLAEAVERNPEDAWAQQQLAQAFWVAGDREAALKVLLSACRIQGYNHELLLTQLVSMLHQLERSSEAVDQVRAALARHGERPSVRLLAMHEFARAGCWDELATLVDVQLDSAPDDTESLLFAALVAHHQGRTRRVDEYVEQALAHRPDNEEAILHIVALLGDLERWEAAETALSWANDPLQLDFCEQGLRILGRNPRYVERCLELARAGCAKTHNRLDYLLHVAKYATCLGFRDEARRALMLAIARHPNDPQPALELARLLSQQGELTAALAAIERARLLGAANDHCDEIRLELLIAAGRWSEVSELSQQLAAQRNDHGRQRAQIAWVIATLHTHGDAAMLTELAQLESEFPLSGDQITEVAQGALDAGRPRLARQLVERALAGDPKANSPLLVLAALHLREGELAMAEATLNELLQRDNTSGRGFELLAWLRWLQERPGAEAAARIALNIDPTRSGAWSALATALLATGERDAALPALEWALALAPRNQRTEIEQALMAWLCGDVDAARSWLARGELAGSKPIASHRNANSSTANPPKDLHDDSAWRVRIDRARALLDEAS
jgi:tetratricopeptide (TPR) repeat protein